MPLAASQPLNERVQMNTPPTSLRGLLAILIAIMWASIGTAAEQPETPRPNILWITCEDISPHLGCYGDTYAVTPNLDRLARQGLRYTRAFATASVCTPARSCLITGVHASSLGTQHLRGPAPLPESVRCFTEYLRRSGYYCSNNVKEDYNFKTPPGAWDESSGTAHWRGRQPRQPFFSVFNLTTTHQGQIRYSAEQFARVNAQLAPGQRHDPAKAPLPPYYPDTPVVRRIVAQLHTQITRMDMQVAGILKQLEEDGLADDTIVFFYSDHGTGLPRHKRWIYDSGTRVPMIVRFPERYRLLAPGEPGTTVDRLVSFVDFAPTVLSLVGLDIPDYMQGRAFLGKQTGRPRDYVFSVRDRVDEVHEFSRTVRDRRWRYIRNYATHRPRMQHSFYSEQTPIRRELRRLAAEDKLTAEPKELMSSTKPAEELYDTQTDPHEVDNLAGSPEHRDTLERLRSVLRKWMLGTRDTGLLPEADMHRRSAGRSPYDMARRTDRFPVARILDAADLVGRGTSTRSRLAALLGDSDAAVRYWAAVGLTAPGADAQGTEDTLRRTLADPSPSVRLAAAEALCRLGHEQDALPVLIDGLGDDDQRVKLQAAIVIVAIGEKARPAIPRINRALAEKAKGNYAQYVRWALRHAAEDLAR